MVRHDVVATVRSHEKAERIQKEYPDLLEGRLTFAIVQDISQPEAFDDVVTLDPPFDAVIHTASPFQYSINDATDFLDPAIKGTVGILNAIKKKAPNVRRVVSHMQSQYFYGDLDGLTSFRYSRRRLPP